MLINTKTTQDVYVVHDRNTTKAWRIVHILPYQDHAIARARYLNRLEGLARFGVVRVQVPLPRKRFDVREALANCDHVFC